MVIFYHGDMDGIAAAHLYLKDTPNFYMIRTVEFEYDKQPSILEALRNINAKSEVIFLDCCPDEDILEAMIARKNIKKITILDHHISKKELNAKQFNIRVTGIVTKKKTADINFWKNRK